MFAAVAKLRRLFAAVQQRYKEFTYVCPYMATDLPCRNPPLRRGTCASVLYPHHPSPNLLK
jgi:hypothetical protein